jgi:NADH:ubiquinone oxidoreductase subunit D
VYERKICEVQSMKETAKNMTSCIKFNSNEPYPNTSTQITQTPFGQKFRKKNKKKIANTHQTVPQPKWVSLLSIYRKR